MDCWDFLHFCAFYIVFWAEDRLSVTVVAAVESVIPADYTVFDEGVAVSVAGEAGSWDGDAGFAFIEGGFIE